MNDDHSTGDPSTGDHSEAPDFIPRRMVNEFEEMARVTVVSSRCLRDIRQPSRADLVLDRMTSGFLKRRVRTILWLSAATAGLVWLSVAPESTALFATASILTVVAIVSSLRLAWRVAGAKGPAAKKLLGGGDDSAEAERQ